MAWVVAPPTPGNGLFDPLRFQGLQAAVLDRCCAVRWRRECSRGQVLDKERIEGPMQMLN